MTYIEFFDRNATENICGALALPPQRVVLIGDKMKLLQKHADCYESLFSRRGKQVEFVCRTVNKNDLDSVIAALSGAVEEFEDCVFDLTGGDELYLVAVGVVSERYRERGLQMHRFNIRNGKITDCDRDGVCLRESDALQLSVRENIRIYGGEVVERGQGKNGTPQWELTGEFRQDLQAMWEICRGEVRLWNTQIGVLAAARELAGEKDFLKLSVSVGRLEELLARKGGKPVFINRLFQKLYDRGLVKDYCYDESSLSVEFKNPQVAECLTKAGQVLEMRIYLAALDARDKEGQPVYGDCANGVQIDWDGELHGKEEGTFDTENEIDVLLMHGLVPVFVSCKNGTVPMEELYKLSTVAERFGGSYAKKVLVATALESDTSYDEYFRQRARDMGIHLVEGVQNMDEKALEKAVKNFWNQ